MIAGLKLNTEFLKFKRSRLTRIAVVFLCLIPLLYSALYLYAFWDPFNKVDQVPVALVNSDRGAVIDGRPLEAGDKVTEGLKDNDKIHWIQTSKEEATSGVASGKYYFSLEVPENFSQAIGSPESDNPQKAQLISTYNDANGYLSTVIGQNVMREVLNVVSSKISAQAVDKVLIGVLDAGSGLQRASIGAGELADGTDKLHNGSLQLNDGAKRLHDGVEEAKGGTTQLREGSSHLNDGLAKLSDGSVQLADGTGQLADRVNLAAGQVNANASNLNMLQDATVSLGNQAHQVNGSVQQLQQSVSAASNEQAEQANNLRAQAKSLRDLGTPVTTDIAVQLENTANALEGIGVGPHSAVTDQVNSLASGTGQLDFQLNDPAAPVRGGVNQLADLPQQFNELQDGVNRINDGATLLRDNLALAHDGSTRLNDGIVRLDDGATQLLDGTNQLQDGTTSLVDGSTRLNDGAHELHTKLEDGYNQVPKWNENQRLDTAATIGGPVAMESFNDSGSHSFGSGLAPFFFSLALYIGGIVVFVMLRPLQARVVNSGIHSWRAALAGYLPSLVIGIGQAIVMVAVTVFAVGLQPANLWGLFGFAMLISAVYMALNQAILAVFGPGPGRVVALAVLMLQMVSSGGLYPVETQSRFFQWIHPFNPMTYTVDGLRQVTYGFYDERLPIAITVLICVGLVSLLATTLSAKSRRTWTMKRLHPPLPA